MRLVLQLQHGDLQEEQELPFGMQILSHVEIEELILQFFTKGVNKHD